MCYHVPHLSLQPWKITKEVIERLTTAEDKWSMSQLMHAVVLIAHFHAFSAFVKGCAHLKAADSREGMCMLLFTIEQVPSSIFAPSSSI